MLGYHKFIALALTLSPNSDRMREGPMRLGGCACGLASAKVHGKNGVTEEYIVQKSCRDE